MTLREQLAKLNSDEMVFIGSRSAFFFIGTPEEFEQQCETLNNLWLKSFSTTYYRSKVAIDMHKKTKPLKTEVVRQKITELHSKKVIEVDVPYENRFAEWDKKLSRLYDNSEHAKLIVDSFVPFEQREVKEIYRNIENDAYIIIVEGYETARFWFKHEYDDFKKDYDESNKRGRRGRKIIDCDVAELDVDNEEEEYENEED